MEKRRPGKPVVHPRVYCLETNRSWDTYTEAAEEIGGNRFGVMRVCRGINKTHKGLHFIHTDYNPNSNKNGGLK